jgi:hypothetical protein
MTEPSECVISDSELDDIIVEKVSAQKYVSFVELTRLLESRRIETKGPCAVTIPWSSNVLLWSGMSPRFSSAIIRLVYAKRIYAHPCSNSLVYLIDGCLLTLPIAKRRREYKTLHWFPVTFCTYPPRQKGSSHDRHR